MVKSTYLEHGEDDDEYLGDRFGAGIVPTSSKVLYHPNDVEDNGCSKEARKLHDP